MRLMRTVPTFLAGLVLAGAGASVAFAAPSFTVPTNCGFDLQQNGLSRYVDPAQVPNGVWFTSNATKKCTISSDRQIILLTCTSKIPSWSGGTQSKKNVACVIKGDQCGVPGTFQTTQATLSVASDGLAQLSCNLQRNR